MIYVTIETLKGGRKVIRRSWGGTKAFATHAAANRNTNIFVAAGWKAETKSFVDIPAAEAFVAAHNATLVTARARAKEYA
jgi:hypothetical protein